MLPGVDGVDGGGSGGGGECTGGGRVKKEMENESRGNEGGKLQGGPPTNQSSQLNGRQVADDLVDFDEENVGRFDFNKRHAHDFLRRIYRGEEWVG